MENYKGFSNSEQWQKFQIQSLRYIIAISGFQAILAIRTERVQSLDYLITILLTGLLISVFYFLVGLLFAGGYKFLSKSRAERSDTFLLALRITFVIAALSSFFQLYESMH